MEHINFDPTSLYNHSVAEVAYPQKLQIIVGRAVTAWRRFIALPPEAKRMTPYIKDHRGTVGYGASGTGVTTIDRKETFEVTLGSIDQLPVTAGNKDLLRASTRLLTAVKPMVSTLATELEADLYPGLHGSVVADQPNWYLRYLHYFGDVLPGSVMAMPHIDKSLITLHLHESDQGLQYLDPADLVWKSMPMCFDSTAVISGIQLQRLTSGATVAACHQVIANHATAVNGRIAIVLFIQDPRGPFYNKAENGSLADGEPGSNYNMSKEKLNRLFTS